MNLRDVEVEFIISLQLLFAISFQFECCGYTNYTDFTDSPFNKNGNYPAACCLDPFNGTLCDQRKADKAVSCFWSIFNHHSLNNKLPKTTLFLELTP